MTDATIDAIPALPDSLALYQEIMGGYGERVKNAHTDRKLLGWLDSLFGATELFWTMDIVPFTPVSNAIALFTAGQGYDYLELGERHGIPPEMCSAHRVVVGMAHERLLDPPDLLVSTAHCCDSGLKVFEILSDFYGCPNYFWDCGYGLDPESMDYYKGEIQGLISFLEERTGRPLDWDRLKEALHLSRRAMDCWRQIGELRKAFPCPSGFNEGMRDFTIMASCSGLPEAVRYFEHRLREVEGKVARREGLLPQERYRLAWLLPPPMFDPGLHDWLAQEYGAVVVMDSLSHLAGDMALDPEEPLDFLAKKRFQLHLLKEVYRPVKTGVLLESAVQMCLEWQAQGAVTFAPWSCKMSSSLVRFLRDAVKERAGTPLLILDGDMLDARVVSSGQMKAKLREFLEMLGGRRS